MKLIILRHAKSSWDSADLADHDRPLAPRGERAAAVIGRWLAAQGHHPAAVLCSTALRTRQTWELMRQHLDPPRDVRYLRNLYHAGHRQIWDALRECDLSPVMIVGHNPGISEFAASAVAAAPRRAEFFRYPTAAATICGFPVESWRSARPGTGRLAGFTVPRDHR